MRVAIRTDAGSNGCSGPGFDVTALKRSPGSGMGWWETQALAGAYQRATGRRVCSLTLREGGGSPVLGVGPGTGQLPGSTLSGQAVARVVRRAASRARLQIVAIVFHKPANITPEVVLLARDPRNFEDRVTSFQAAFEPTFKRLDAAYVAVRDTCGEPVWYSGGSIVTGGGEVWADRHWICPFGDAISQHCPSRRATAANRRV
jgi:hypothetical protein